MFKKIVIAFLLFMPIAYGNASQLEDNISLQALHEKAEKNDSQALLQLAILYLNGKKVPQDKVKGIFFLQKAQSLGNKKADEILKTLQNSLNHPNKKLIHNLKKRAESGDIHSMTTLAMLYIEGKGVEKDVQKGVLMLEKATAAGNNNARAALGMVYLTGKNGVAQDLQKAQDLLNEAAKNGNFAAQTLLKCLQQSVDCPKN